MKMIPLTLGLAVALASATISAEEPKPDQPKASHPPREGETSERSDLPKPGAPNHEAMEKHRAENQKSDGDGRHEEARNQSEAARREDGREGGREPERPRGEDGARSRDGSERPSPEGHGAKHEDASRAREEIMKLHREGRHDEANRRIEEMKRNLPETRGDVRGGPGGDSSAPDVQARSAHLREAAEHLHAAGMAKEADHFRQLADQMLRTGSGGNSLPPEVARRFEALEQSMQNLAKQLEAVGDELKRRGS